MITPVNRWIIYWIIQLNILSNPHQAKCMPLQWCTTTANSGTKCRTVGHDTLPQEYSILDRLKQTVSFWVHGDKMLAVWIFCQRLINPVHKGHFLLIWWVIKEDKTAALNSKLDYVSVTHWAQELSVEIKYTTTLLFYWPGLTCQLNDLYRGFMMKITNRNIQQH